MGNDKKLDEVPKDVPDPSGDVLQHRPCSKCGCVRLNSLGCLGMSHSRVVTDNMSSP